MNAQFNFDARKQPRFSLADAYIIHACATTISLLNCKKKWNCRETKVATTRWKYRLLGN